MSNAVTDETTRPFRQFSFQRVRPTFNPVYGRFIGLFRIILPTIATALIVLVAVWPQLSKDTIVIGPANIDKKDAENLQMVNARYTGVDASKRPFAITADSADQENAKSVTVALKAPKADILLQNGTWIALTATNGIFNREEQLLELQGAVNLFHDSGYEFQTSSAVFDMKAGDATGTENVVGQGPFGRLQAEGFRVYNRGQRVQFTGKAKLTILPKSGDGG